MVLNSKTTLPSLQTSVKVIAGLIMGLGALGAHAQSAVYDGAGLNIPVVEVGSSYYEAYLEVINANPLELRLSSAVPLPSGSTNETTPTFSGGVVNFPSVIVGNQESMATLDVIDLDTFTFRLASAALIDDNIDPDPPVNTAGFTSQGNGNCVNMNPPDIGTLATYLTTSSVQGEEIVSDFTVEYLELSSTHSVVETVSTLEIQGFSNTTTTTTRNDFYIDGNSLYQQEINSTSSSTLVGSFDVSITFMPDYFAGAAETFCEGMAWATGEVEQTTTTTQLGVPNVTSTISSTSRVDAVNQSVSVPAGTFDTVVIRTPDTDQFPYSLSYNDPTTGVSIKSESFGNDGSLEAVVELTELQQ